MISHSICQIDISYCHLLVSFPYTHFHALNLFPTNNLATRFDLGAGGLEDSPRRSNRASGFYHKQGFHLTTCRLVLPWSYIATVDGSEIRNNQLIDRWFISWFLGFYIYISVQDFLHQQICRSHFVWALLHAGPVAQSQLGGEQLRPQAVRNCVVASPGIKRETVRKMDKNIACLKVNDANCHHFMRPRKSFQSHGATLQTNTSLNKSNKNVVDVQFVSVCRLVKVEGSSSIYIFRVTFSKSGASSIAWPGAALLHHLVPWGSTAQLSAKRSQEKQVIM